MLTIETKTRTQTIITASSWIRVVTKPSDAASFCRLITGYTATADPMPASAVSISRTAPCNRLLTT